MLTTDRKFFIKYTEDKHEEHFIQYAEQLGEDLDQCELFFEHNDKAVRSILKTPNNGNFLLETLIKWQQEKQLTCTISIWEKTWKGQKNTQTTFTEEIIRKAINFSPSL